MSFNIQDIYFVFGRYIPTSSAVQNAVNNTIQCATMSENGVAFCVIKDRKGQHLSCLTGDLGKLGGLEDWIGSLRHQADCRLAFGPGDRYLAWSAIGDYALNTIPDGEEASHSAAGFGRLSLATLGVDWAYFYLRPDGRWKYNLKGHYKTLGNYLEDLQPGDIEFIALNPYFVEEFFLLLKNHTAIFRVPLSYRDDLMGALEKHGISCLDVVPQRATTGMALPSKLRKKSFWKDFGKHVAVNSMGATIGAVAQSLVGSATCVMM